MDGRNTRRALRWTALLAGGLVGAGAALHLPVARPLLGRLGMACPVRSVSAEQVDAARRPALRALQGGASAPRRPALGLALGGTREADARAWAARHGIACAENARAPRALMCQDVPPTAVGRTAGSGAIDDLVLAFDAEGSLVAVDALRRGLTAASAASAGSAVEERLRRELGRPAEAAGQWSAAYFDGGAMRTSLLRYRFRDYLAFVTATHVPGRGVLLREQYLSGSGG